MTERLRSDTDTTARRRRELHDYFERAVDDGERLVCMFGNRCRASVGTSGFAAGQLSHVGEHYDLREGDAPLRVLVVPMQTGRDDQHVTLGRRAAQVETAKPLSARPMPRTPQMDGTALALKTVLGVPLDAPDDLLIGDRPAHVFDCYAMHNATLCSRLGSSTSGGGTREMHEMCGSHLRELVRILEPTVIVAQGWTKTGNSPSLSVARALGVPLPARGTCTPVEVEHGRLAFVALVHPSRNWAGPNRKFLDEVEPALRAARDFALDG